MTKRLLLLSRTGWQRRNLVCAGKSQRALCGVLALIISGCGGGGGGGGSNGSAQPFAEILYYFGTSPPDAMGPDGGLFQGSDGSFYGTTSGGGIDGGVGPGGTYTGDGTVFKITSTGSETVLHLFTGPPADGANPEIVIQGTAGNFYGTTNDGGADNTGTVFRLTPEGVETILYSFLTTSETGSPAGGLVQGIDGNLYGTTFGVPGNEGTLFKLTPEGVLTILHTFHGGADDGALPFGSLFQGSDGSIYGVTESGGAADDGTVFKISLEGIETILHSFSGSDGSPFRLIQGTDGNLYGTTGSGGAHNFGTVFKLTAEGVETILYSFTDSSYDGGYPFGLIEGHDGNFYGTTSGGGMNHLGTVFKLTPSGVVSVLYSFRFPDQSNTNLVQGSDGNLYGATYGPSSGAHDSGYFFELILN